MSFLKQVRWTNFLFSVALLITGVLLLIFQGTVMKMLCWILGAVVFLSGAVKVVEYLRTPAETRSALQADFILGILYAVIGVILLSQASFILRLLYLLVGIFVLIDGVTRLQTALEIRKNRPEGSWQFMLAASVVTCLLGLLLIINPFGVSDLLTIMIGITLIVVGIQDIVAGLVVRKYLKETAALVNADAENTID